MSAPSPPNLARFSSSPITIPLSPPRSPSTSPPREARSSTHSRVSSSEKALELRKRHAIPNLVAFLRQVVALLFERPHIWIEKKLDEINAYQDRNLKFCSMSQIYREVSTVLQPLRYPLEEQPFVALLNRVFLALKALIENEENFVELEELGIPLYKPELSALPVPASFPDSFPNFVNQNLRIPIGEHLHKQLLAIVEDYLATKWVKLNYGKLQPELWQNNRIYTDVVQHPIDLETIHNELLAKRYANVEEFYIAMTRLWQNTILYWSTAHLYGTSSRILQFDFDKQIFELNLNSGHTSRRRSKRSSILMSEKSEEEVDDIEMKGEQKESRKSSSHKKRNETRSSSSHASSSNRAKKARYVNKDSSEDKIEGYRQLIKSWFTQLYQEKEQLLATIRTKDAEIASLKAELDSRNYDEDIKEVIEDFHTRIKECRFFVE